MGDTSPVQTSIGRGSPTTHRGAVGAMATAVAVIGWTYLGYPLTMALASRSRRRAGGGRETSEAQLPSMTVIVPALNEEAVIADKLADLRRSDYPADKLTLMVVADGSTDRTPEIARREGATVLSSEHSGGKSDAVNRGIAASDTELLCLTDANCSLAPGALRALAEAFTDPRVAVVSGAKTVSGSGGRAAGEGLYWRMESAVKSFESAFGCTTGAVGEICGLRRSSVRPIPDGVINDDYHLTCDALVRGLAVGYAAEARAVEAVPERLADEFERRSRIGAGAWQTTLAHIRLVDPRRGWVALAFGSHRVLRSVVVPPLLPALAVTSMIMSRRSPIARALAYAQAAFYGTATAGLLVDARITAAPLQLVLTNAATLAGAVRYLRGRQPAQWSRVRRGQWISA